MLLENTLRRSPDIEGTAVKFANSEEFLIPEVPIRPLFERKEGHWEYVGLTEDGPFDRLLLGFRQMTQTAGDGRIVLDGDAAENWLKSSAELQAEALSLNYDVKPEDLKELCDPSDFALTAMVAWALRGGVKIEERLRKKPKEIEEEKKTNGTGSIPPLSPTGSTGSSQVTTG